jgi:aminoglycoside phosphotransferase (APT) family kinase protein
LSRASQHATAPGGDDGRVASRGDSSEEVRSHRPHGFGLGPDDEHLLRGPVPPGALRWAAAAVGAGARVREVRALEGGASAAVHVVSVEDASGRVHGLVLRRFVRADWLAREPGLARREATALELVAHGGPPTPRLVAVDPEGREAGVPAVLMTRLPGRIEWHPAALDAFLRRLAELLPAIHATPVPSGASLPAYEPYELELRRPPRWAARPEVWRRAMAVLDGPPPSPERVLVHRDFHPGNVLWRRDAVSGVVDWVNASIGSPWADVGHCRVNLAEPFGQAAAERFLEHYRAAAGRRDDPHPYWDIAAALGGLDESYDAEPSPADEAFLAAAVSRL